MRAVILAIPLLYSACSDREDPSSAPSMKEKVPVTNLPVSPLRGKNPDSSPWILEVMADYGSSGIWGGPAVGPFRHSMISHATLGIPADMAARFKGWIAWHNRALEEADFDYKKFNAAGEKLAQELGAYFGDQAQVTYTPID